MTIHYTRQKYTQRDTYTDTDTDSCIRKRPREVLFAIADAGGSCYLLLLALMGVTTLVVRVFGVGGSLLKDCCVVAMVTAVYLYYLFMGSHWPLTDCVARHTVIRQAASCDSEEESSLLTFLLCMDGWFAFPEAKSSSA